MSSRAVQRPYSVLARQNRHGTEDNPRLLELGKAAAES